MTQIIQPAWFKPSDHEKTLFIKYTEAGALHVRSLQLPSDLDTLYDWVNRDYSRQFWQMNGSKKVLLDTYAGLLENPAAHSFLLLLNQQPVAQVDLYLVQSDELGKHVAATGSDCGMHLLMLPPRESFKGLSREALRCFIEFYFSFSTAGNLYAEPDRENEKANLLAKKAGFQFLKTVELSYKTANLYVFTRGML